MPITEFLFGLQWSPQTALRADQVGSSGAFGAVPLFAGTLLITLIAMLVAGPIGMFSAIYLSQYASSGFRNWAKPILEILAGIPTVVYGFFAALTVAPLIREAGQSIGLDVSSESALAAGLVMGIMIIPFVSSLADDAISAVPLALRDASYGLGATRAETIVQVLIPAALPGIVARLPARDQPRGRRDHDRGHGGRPRGQSDRESAAGGDHGHRADRHPARRAIRNSTVPRRCRPSRWASSCSWRRSASTSWHST